MRAQLPPEVLVYGAGTFGRGLADALRATGVTVRAILDRSAQGDHQGLPILAPGDPATRGLTVVLGLHNPHTPSDEVADTLGSLGYPEVITTVEAMTWLGRGGIAFEHYWLTSDVTLYERSRPQIARVESLLADPTSIELWRSLLRYREAGRLDDLPTPDPVTDQYLAPDLLPRIDLRRILDCGAYDGDSLRSLAELGAHPEWVLCLEPDPGNFASLCRTAAASPQLRAMCIPLGAWGATEQLRFSGDGTSAASVTDGGTTTIQVVRIDDLLSPGWDPTYIKMDIEGAELPALAGARATIVRSRPGLAVSLYHRPDDLWQIPLWVEQHAPGAYDFFLRQYGENCFETVLYCLTKDSA